MNAPVKYGLILGVVVGVLGFVIAGLGLHTRLGTSMAFMSVSVIVNVVVVFLALRETAASATWTGQLRNSLILGAVGAVVVFASSWVMTALVFPDYHAEYAAATRDALAGTGLPVEQPTPAGAALSGSIGTIATSLIVGALVGIFKRQGS